MRTVAATSSARTRQLLRAAKALSKNRLSIEISKVLTQHACPLHSALRDHALLNSERDEHGMRQALRLARMRAPRGAFRARAGRGPGAGQRQRDFYGGANRTRLWPRTKHLQPLLPTVPTEHPLGRRLLRLGPPHVATHALVCLRHVARVDTSSSTGVLVWVPPVANLFSALFGDWNEPRAANPRENQLRTPGCPAGVCPTGNAFKEAAKSRRSFFPNEPPEDWQPPGVKVGTQAPLEDGGRASGASSTSMLIYLNTRNTSQQAW